MRLRREIPTHWQLKNLGEVCEIIAGQSPPSSTYRYSPDGLPFFQGKADFGKRFPVARVWCVKPTKTARAGDILISVRAPVGPTNVATSDCCIGRGLAAIRPKGGIDRDFILHALRFFEGDLVQQGSGSTFEAITSKDLDSFSIPLPPLPEQRRIAVILDKADVLREKRRQAIAKLDALLKSVFIEMFGDPVTNPKGWVSGRISDLCEDIVDCPHSTPVYATTITPYACWRSSDIQNGYIDRSTTKYVSIEEYNKRIQRTTLKKGDVIYCREGARFGNAARILDEERSCLGQRMMLMRAAYGKGTAEYLWAFLNYESTYQGIVRLAGGSASPHVNVGDIKSFAVLMPPFNIQQRFSMLVRRIDQMRADSYASASKSTDLFSSLQQRAFSGELFTEKGVSVPHLAEASQHV